MKHRLGKCRYEVSGTGTDCFPSWLGQLLELLNPSVCLPWLLEGRRKTLAKEIPESVLACTVEGQVPDGPSLQDLSQEETGHSRKGILKTVL